MATVNVQHKRFTQVHVVQDGPISRSCLKAPHKFAGTLPTCPPPSRKTPIALGSTGLLYSLRTYITSPGLGFTLK